MAESPTRRITIVEVPGVPPTVPTVPPEKPPTIPNIPVYSVYISANKTYVYTGETVRIRVDVVLAETPYAEYVLPVTLYANGESIATENMRFPVGAKSQSIEFEVTFTLPSGVTEKTYSVYAETPDYATPVS